MLKLIDGKWTIVSHKTQKPLAVYKGEGKPPEDWVLKQESTLYRPKVISEASYRGNVGFMELISFHAKATPKQKEELKSHIKNKKHEDMRKLIHHVTGVRLHKSVSEESDPDILNKSGAGQEGTDELVKSYMKDTPGQDYKKFKRYIEDK